MKRAIDGILAKRIDSYSIENGMPSLVLMERAAMKRQNILLSLWGQGARRVPFLSVPWEIMERMVLPLPEC